MESEDEQLNRGLSARHVGMIALGGTIGTGLFLGAGNSISLTGPFILVVYLITGLFMFLMMRALGELLLTNVKEKTFISFITKYLGEKTGFIIGWSYWAGWITIAMAELTAIALYMKYWFPNTEAWVWEIIFIILLYVTNIIAVEIFGELEYWFSMIKIIAIIAMIITGIVMVLGHVKTEDNIAQMSNLWKYKFIPFNGKNILIAFQMVFYAFLGMEFVGLTASETKNPHDVIPKAINSTVYRILIFYIGALIAIMTIQPWTVYTANKSPFVQVFSGIGLSSAATLINFVVLTAAASALNSSIFATGRMLYSLSKNTKLGKLSKKQIPIRAINVSVLVICLAVLINYIYPTSAFEKITSVASASFIFIYSSFLLTHIKYRKSEDYKNGKKLYKMPFSPITDYLTLIFFIVIFIILLTNKETRDTAILTVGWYLLLMIISMFKIKNKKTI